MSFLAASEEQSARLVRSVRFTEEYRDRFIALLSPTLRREAPAAQKPVRGILLQNAFDGNDALMCLVGRSLSSLPGWLVSLVGVNQFPTTSNQFQLKLSGGTLQPDGVTYVYTVIGTNSAPINCCSTALDVFNALLTISGIDGNSLSVGLGNPYYDFDLLVYGDVVPPSRVGDAPASYIGAWYIQIGTLLGYDTLVLEVVNAAMSSLTNVVVQKMADILDTETTVVTDCSYRTSSFPWQVGSIASCLDYADIGYGILSSTARTIDVQ